MIFVISRASNGGSNKAPVQGAFRRDIDHMKNDLWYLEVSSFQELFELLSKEAERQCIVRLNKIGVPSIEIFDAYVD